MKTDAIIHKQYVRFESKQAIKAIAKNADVMLYLIFIFDFDILQSQAKCR